MTGLHRAATLGLLLSSMMLDAGQARADDPEPTRPVQDKRSKVQPIAAPTDERPPSADAQVDEEAIDYFTPRTEPAGFPIIGGNSDIGFQFGFAGRLARFDGGKRPYVYRADLLLTASVRNNGERLGLAQQDYLGQLDVPNLFGGRVRTNAAFEFLNFVDAGYFGRGNASSSTVPSAVAGERNRYFQQVAREFRIRDFNRIRIERPFDFVIGPIFRFHDHEAYSGSKLEQDAQAGIVRGLRPVPIFAIATGLIIDTRDNEFFPHRGMYHQIGQRFDQGFPLDGDVQSASTGALLAGYLPLGGPFVAAARAVIDLKYGNVPYYYLYNAGIFGEWEMPGGSNGIRGVPWGRYSAPIKTLANFEVRAMHTRFRILGQRFRLGNDVFFDVGRVFDNYTFDSPRDGRRIGLKVGVGGGLYVLWGEAAIFRIEAAYSPDAVASNPSFPIGLYVADGVMF